MTERKRLFKIRENVLARFKICKTYSNKIQNLYDGDAVIPELEREGLKMRVARLENILAEFDVVQADIETASTSENLPIQMAERESFENDFFEVLSKLKVVLNSQVISTLKEENDVSHMEKRSPIKMPPIAVPQFDGKVDAWLEFKGIFESLVHSNQQINSIEKLHYLKAALKGEAAQMARSIDFTSEGYHVAWKALCSRYDNNRMLIDAHIKALFNVEAMPKESSKALRGLIDELAKRLRSLEMLKMPVVHWDTLVLYLVTQKLDLATLRAWEEFRAGIEVPTMKQFYDFAKSRADLLETLECAKTPTRAPKTQVTKTFVSGTNSCLICNEQHEITACDHFKRLSLPDRFDKARDLRLCWKCLKQGHPSRRCRAAPCKVCKGWHSYFLHDFTKGNPNTKVEEVKVNAAVSSLTANVRAETMLSTARVAVLGKDGRTYEARVLLDSASQASFITEALCKRLKLNVKRVDLTISGLGNIVSHTNRECDVQMRSRSSNYTTKLSCFVLKKITNNVPSTSYDLKLDLDDMQLADPKFSSPGKIDMLIGANLFWSLILPGQKNLERGVLLQNTKLGWLVTGSIPGSRNELVSCNLVAHIDIQDQLARFWELEECSEKPALSSEEIACEQHYDKHTQRSKDGRFVVTIPLKFDIGELGASRDQAVRRFLSMERRLGSNSRLNDLYQSFMNEYQALGHMVVVSEQSPDDLVSYYMPHHGVLREDHTTTKLRVVFDASAKTTSGVSLNDLQMAGPVIQADLVSILLRFRCYAYVITADVSKMYRQVQINESQRSLQRIVWRNSPDEELKTYELTTVTYGTKAASYLAIRSLQQLGRDREAEEPDIAQIIAHGFYVDDFLSGADTVSGAAHICSRVSEILAGGCFQLRKWTSNEPSIFDGLNLQRTAGEVFCFGQNELTKTLGLVWASGSDELMYQVKPQTYHDIKITKRAILSRVAQIYDPLGLISPCIAIAKVLLQQLWLLKVSWDEALPLEVASKWQQFESELVKLNALRIDRHATMQDARRIEVHGFSDASEKGYGGCVYLKSTGVDGQKTVKILCSKTKVAPLKCLTIPKLELCGALVLARLIVKVFRTLNFTIDRCVLWSDSTVVLGWLKTQPHMLKPFVSNRVVEIQSLKIAHEWRHVPTRDNPADLLSRGLSPALIGDSALWWCGPKWLTDDDDRWPVRAQGEIKLPEMRTRINCFFNKTTAESFLFDKFSDLNRLKRVTAYLLRFRRNCSLPRDQRKLEPLSIDEKNEALTCLIKLSQRNSFRAELDELANDRQVNSKSKILSLHPFLDGRGLLRVGGRLENSQFRYDKIHPLILSAKHEFTGLLFQNEHKRLLHAGPQLLLATIRETYWPVGGKNLAKKTVRQCLSCFRARPRFVQPLMGNLPGERFESGYPFLNTGVDYGGPIMIKDKKGRGARLNKCYICLFVCLATKAVHLEVVTDLSTECFIAAFRRFVSRRGKPVKMFSDNGTNFVGANNDLKELHAFVNKNAKVLQDKIENESVAWRFIPPRSPHMGGLWEAGIKSVKYHLKRVVGNASLTYEQLCTTLAQVEAVLNSRPLYQLSSDPEDLNPITPAHFLIGRSLSSLADPDVTKVPANRLSPYQRIQQIRQHFWMRWSLEYISECQQRQKWKKNCHNIKVGTLVLIKEDNMPPMVWKMGRVMATHAGADEVVRVVTLRTAAGSCKRSVVKVCPLPNQTV